MLAQIFTLKDQVALRLREARDALSLKPMDLANAAGVSRATQYNYENGQTPPDVNYLQKVQTLGMDIPYVLFSTHAEEFTTKSEKDRFDWQLLEMAIEEVETVCLTLNETCPPRLKSKLVRQLYETLKANNVVDKESSHALAREIWHHET
jgi:transcriptional regulator with XRE-family HTH domain